MLGKNFESFFKPLFGIAWLFFGFSNTVNAQTSDLLNYTFDNANGDVTDTIGNPIVSNSYQWTSTSNYTPAFGTATPLPISFIDSDARAVLNFSAFNVANGSNSPSKFSSPRPTAFKL